MRLVTNNLSSCGEGNSIARLEHSTAGFQSGTVFGVVLEGVAHLNSRIAYKGEYFCVAAPVFVLAEGTTALFVRESWKGKTIYAGRIEETGDVKYIDGCTDSLLVCPPRLGDPCLNALYFPAGVNQTFHTHPSQRLGAVLSGSGYACFEGEEVALTPGTVFVIETDEVHRFRTEGDPMVVIAYHPDSDWGPTDEVHPMINRTVIEP